MKIDLRGNYNNATDLVVTISENFTCNDFIAQLRNHVAEEEGCEYLDDFLDTGELSSVPTPNCVLILIQFA